MYEIGLFINRPGIKPFMYKEMTVQGANGPHTGCQFLCVPVWLAKNKGLGDLEIQETQMF